MGIILSIIHLAAAPPPPRARRRPSPPTRPPPASLSCQETVGVRAALDTTFPRLHTARTFVSLIIAACCTPPELPWLAPRPARPDPLPSSPSGQCGGATLPSFPTSSSLRPALTQTLPNPSFPYPYLPPLSPLLRRITSFSFSFPLPPKHHLPSPPPLPHLHYHLYPSPSPPCVVCSFPRPGFVPRRLSVPPSRPPFAPLVCPRGHPPPP